MKHVETARIFLTATAVALFAASGAAHARPDTRSLNCAQAQALVEHRQAVVLTTGAHTYDRFVSGQRFCPLPYVAKLTWVRTNDNDQCPIGYTCQQNTGDDFFGR